jgi:hypothetical protein
MYLRPCAEVGLMSGTRFEWAASSPLPNTHAAEREAPSEIRFHGRFIVAGDEITTRQHVFKADPSRFSRSVKPPW